jgi:hypothetical protein
VTAADGDGRHGRQCTDQFIELYKGVAPISPVDHFGLAAVNTNAPGWSAGGDAWCRCMSLGLGAVGDGKGRVACGIRTQYLPGAGWGVCVAAIAGCLWLGGGIGVRSGFIVAGAESGGRVSTHT